MLNNYDEMKKNSPFCCCVFYACVIYFSLVFKTMIVMFIKAILSQLLLKNESIFMTFLFLVLLVMFSFP